MGSVVGSCQTAQRAGTRSAASGSAIRGYATRSTRTPERSAKLPSTWQSSDAQAAELSIDIRQVRGWMNAAATSWSPPAIRCTRNGKYGIHESLRSDSNTLLSMKWAVDLYLDRLG